MENIFAALRADHEIQRKLMAQISKTSGDSEERRELFEKLTVELEKHAKFEERVFYIPLMKDDKTQDQSRHSIAEHQQIDKKLAELKDTEFSSTGWLNLFHGLEHDVEHHLKEEEQGLFQLAGKVFSEKQKAEFAERYDQQMADARSESSAHS